MKNKMKSLQALAMVMALAAGSVTVVASAETKVSTGASIGIGHSSSSVGTGISLGVGIGGVIGIGSDRDSSGVGVGVVIGNGVYPEKMIKAGQAQRESQLAELSQRLSDSSLRDTYFRVTTDKKSYAIYNGLGQEIVPSLKDQYAFTVVNPETNQKNLMVVEEKNKEVTVTNYNDKTSFTVPGKKVFPDYQDIVVKVKSNEFNVYNIKGQQLNSVPLRSYVSLDSANYAMQKAKKRGYQLLSKKDFQVMNPKSYDLIVANNPQDPPKGIRFISDYDMQVEDFNAQGETREELVFGGKNYAKTPAVLANGAKVKSILAPFSEGISIVDTNEGIFGIDEQGKILYHLDSGKYDSFGPYNHGLSRVRKAVPVVNLVGIFGDVIGISNGDYGFGNDYSWYRDRDRFGYINREGREVISTEGQYVSPYNEPYIVIYRDSKFGIASPSGKFIFPPMYKEVRQGTVINGDMEFIVKADNNKWGVVNMHNHFIVNPEYSDIKRLNSWAYKMEKDKADYIYAPLTQAMYGPFLDVEDSENNFTKDPVVIVEKTKGEFAIIDLAGGKTLAEIKADEVEAEEGMDNLVVVKRAGLYGVYTLDGKEVVPVKYIGIKGYDEED